VIGVTNRFHGRGSLARHYKQSKSVRTMMMALRYNLNQQRDSYRLAVVVSRKVSKSAVVRNRIRRRVFENVRILSSEFMSPVDLVIIVYDEKVAQLPAPQLRQDIIKLCQKAGVVAAHVPQHAIVEPKE
jgi:ribonuclease P protein component